MGFRQRLARLFIRENTSNPSTHPGGSPSLPPRKGGDLLTLYYPQGDAMTIATVYRCVRLLSESVASLPVQYLKRTRDGVFVDAGDTRMDYLLNVQPEGALSAFDFWRTVVMQLLLRGNAYAVPRYSPVTGTLYEIKLCGVGTVAHDTTNGTYAVNDMNNGIYGTFDEDEIIHIKGLPGACPKTGVSVLAYARQSIGIAQAGDSETLNRFLNGGDVRGIVSNSGDAVRGFGEYQDEELEKTAGNIDERFRNGERIVSLPGDVGFKQISLTSADMQFLESRKFGVLEICRFFGVHPSFVFSDTATNYKSAEQANMAFLSHTLAPLLRNIEGELRRKLLSPSLSARYSFRFNPRSLHACDLAGMADYRAKMLQTGSTVNEVRRMENLPPVEGGDTVMVSANLKSLDTLLGESLPAEPQEEDTEPQKNKNDQDEGDEK